ncbi:uncharacterized protein TRIADDRAFT_57261 [Trichoplax adhaerens]|uniref:Uncharacterized protein n=1 Tax=Trichoplax adhaerens TaxID=10228 RepID=B3RYY6_TRIAD|nr:predicted protein [Trichoplax adhaerens]EDV24107.1 predicted protein [Trichoplax adhaerens]|eukprot:XP_002113633.1 predicted protein [Trichoplax adhaerens]
MTAYRQQIDDQNLTTTNTTGNDSQIGSTALPTAESKTDTFSTEAISDNVLANKKPPSPYLMVESYFNFVTNCFHTSKFCESEVNKDAQVYSKFLRQGKENNISSHLELQSFNYFKTYVTYRPLLQTNYVTLQPYTGSFIEIPEISDRCTEGKVYSARLKIDKKIKVKELLEKFPCRLRFNKDCRRTCHSSVFRNTEIKPDGLQPLCEIMQFNCKFSCPSLAGQQ